MRIFIVTLAVFCILITKRCHHARSEDVCVAKRFFSKKAQDAVLINHVIAEHQVSSVIDCAHRCMRKPRCVSFNFEDHSTSPGHVCQINDEKRQDNFKSFVRLDGFTYYEFEQPLACGVGSCQNGGSCVEQCDGKSKCICTEGYTGEHCESTLSTEILSSPVTDASSCKELYDKRELRHSQVVPLMIGEQMIDVYCHVGDFGCGDGGWTLAMKINGSKRTFHYNSHFWNDTKGYNLTAGQTGFDTQETKLPTYWNTSFSKICLGMKIGQKTNFIVINKTANSLYSLIADGQYRATSLGRNTWKKLIGSQASLQLNCNKEGFNAVSSLDFQAKARIGIINNQENDCDSCDSRIGFGTGGNDDDDNTCGNEATYEPDNGVKHIKAMGYILVQ